MTEAKNRFTELTDRVQREHSRFTVTRNGRPAAVVVSIAEWESLHETLDILSDAEEVAEIRQGLEDVARGDVYDLEEVARDMADRRKSAG